MIASISYVKEVMGELKAKKKYGQNFLIDANIVDNIAKKACDKELKTIEIGPGLGALTERLLVYSKDVDAYEIDKDMYERLVKTLSDERLHVYLEDFLKCDLSRYSEKVMIFQLDALRQQPLGQLIRARRRHGGPHHKP